MSEAVEILIKATDEASPILDDTAKALEQAQKRGAALLKSLEEPNERYARQLEELRGLQAQGAITAEQFANAEAKLAAKMAAAAVQVDQAATATEKAVTKTASATDAFKDTGRKTKAVADFAGVLANLTGNTQVASFASQMASATEKVSQFSEVSKAGAAGALGFKLGLIGLAATIGFAIGKAIADVVWQTKKWERAMADAKTEAAALDDRIKKIQGSIFQASKADLELIRDPEEKRAAQQKLFDELNRDLAQANAQVEKSKRLAEEWAEAWQITGERKAEAEEAEEQLRIDRARLETLRDQRDEVAKMLSVREQERAAIRKANEEKDRSESYLETLRQEVEYLKATREEQIALDAARETTTEDRGEAERLLKERDAILAKAEAEKQAAAEAEKAREEARQAAQRAWEEAEREDQRVAEEREREAQRLQEQAAAEQQRIQDRVKAEEERLALQRIEIEQGKEAARVQSLINGGIDEATARRLAAEEAAIEKLKQQQEEQESPADSFADKGSKELGPLAAVQGRLLTRGPGSQRDDWERRTAAALQAIMASTQTSAEKLQDADEKLGFIDDNTSDTTQMVMTA